MKVIVAGIGIMSVGIVAFATGSYFALELLKSASIYEGFLIAAEE